MLGTYLRFTIEKGSDSIVLNDTTSDTTKFYTISETPDIELAVRTDTRERLGRHFVKSAFSFYGQRNIKFVGQIVAGSKSDMETLVANLRKMFSLPPLPNTSNDGNVLIKWTDERGLSWQMYAKVSADVRITSIFNMPFVRNFEINLFAEDGLIYSQTENNENGLTAFYAASVFLPFTLPVSMAEMWWNEVTINNQGNFPAPAVFQLNGLLENPKITLVETGEFIYLDGYTIPLGNYVTIDVAEGTIELDDGTDLSGYLSTDSTWFYLNSGSNTIRMTHDGFDGDGSLTITWRDVEI